MQISDAQYRLIYIYARVSADWQTVGADLRRRDLYYIGQPANVMPPYVEKLLSDQDVRDVQAYLAGIPRLPAVKDIPLLAP